jgi:hypothetical protein
MGDRPIRAGEWARYTVEGEVAADAVDIETGVLSSGKATVFVKDLAFEKVEAPAADAAPLRANYAQVDAANAAGDSAAIAALALPDAEVVLPSGTLRLAAVLNGASIQSKTTVTRVRVEGPEATVWTNNETFSGVEGVLTSNRDLWVRGSGGWKLKRSTLIATRPVTPPEVLAGIRAIAGMPDLHDVRIVLWQGDPKPLPGFTRIPAQEPDAAQRALAFLQQHAPEEAGPAELAFQGDDPARMAAVVRVFDELLDGTAEWRYARHAAAVVYQVKTMPPEQVVAANILWYAAEAMPKERLLVSVPNAAAVAPMVRNRYGKQVYVVGTIPRELLGGDYFLDLARVPPGTPLARWVAAQKLPFDAVAAI